MPMCQDCGQYCPEEFITNHKKHCTSPKSFEKCSFCKMVVEGKGLKKHEAICEKNPKYIHFKDQVSAPKIEKSSIKFNSPPPEKTSKNKCSICEINFPMAQSNICYECKDK